MPSIADMPSEDPFRNITPEGILLCIKKANEETAKAEENISPDELAKGRKKIIEIYRKSKDSASQNLKE
jgi:hypothetical protein